MPGAWRTRAALTSPGTESSRAQRFGLVPAFSAWCLLRAAVIVRTILVDSSQQAINLPVSTTRPQSSIALLAKLSWDLRSPHRPSAAAKRDTPSSAPRCLRCSRHNGLARLLEAAQNIAASGQGVIARSSEYSVRFHASYASGPRSSRDPKTQQYSSSSSSVNVTGAQLRTIAHRWARARSCSPGITNPRRTLHQAQMLHQCLQPSLVHHTKRHRARKLGTVYGLTGSCW